MKKASVSIVARTAIYAASCCAVLCFVFFLVLVEVQRGIYETKIVRDTEEVVATFASFMIGFFYSQGNWVHLEEHQHKLNAFSNTLYSYIVNADGGIDLGIDGFDAAKSPDVGKLKQNWEPDLPKELEKPFRLEFKANDDLVKRFPSRLEVGDKVVLIGWTVLCAYERPCGQLRLAVAFDTLNATLTKLRRVLWLLGFALCFITAIVVYWTTKRQLQPLKSISERMRRVAQSLEEAGGLERQGGPEPEASGVGPALLLPTKEPTEIKLFKESLNQFTTALSETNRLSRELEISKSLSALATQVAHDIRSPLATLRILLDQASALPEEQQRILRRALTRISDIANDMLSAGRGEQNFAASATINAAAPQLVSPWLAAEAIASEQRVQNIAFPHLEITTECDDESYSSFISIEPKEFGRLLSNLVGNSIEAIIAKSVGRNETLAAGRVSLRIRQAKDMGEGRDQAFAEVQIEDNGVGIAHELIPRLGERGFTFGKKDGSGLGIFHARTVAERIGGQLSISSTLGEGTVVSLLIPLTSAPFWFPRSIILRDGQTVVVADDSESAHDIWLQRLSPKAMPWAKSLKLRHFYSPAEFDADLELVADDSLLPVLYLIDYEFRGSSLTGLDLIAHLQHSAKAAGAEIILVTGRFDDPNVMAEVQNLGVRMLPKPLAWRVPLIPWTEISHDVDAVLLDDDPFVRAAWEYEATRRGLKLQIYSSADKLMEDHHSMSSKAVFFVDVSLNGDDLAGIGVARMLIAKGCPSVYLATGFEAQDLPEIQGLKGICGKEMPLWLVPPTH